MKNSSIQVELLLIASTSLTMLDLCEKVSAKIGDLSVEEKLEQACWNGLLNDLFPKFIQLLMDERKYFIWQIRKGESLLQIQLSDSVIEIAAQSSIDPYLFLSPIYNN